MPRSPINTLPLLVVKSNRFMARPKVYTSTGGHPGIDIWSPLGQDWTACVNGVLHIINKLKSQWGLGSGDPSYSRYGAAVAIDWGQGDGSFIRFVYGHGRNRKLGKDNQHIGEGDYVSESGNTGFSSGPHLHLEMRHYPRNGTGRYYDGLLRKRYNLQDPEKEFLIKYKIPYRLA